MFLVFAIIKHRSFIDVLPINPRKSNLFREVDSHLEIEVLFGLEFESVAHASSDLQKNTDIRLVVGGDEVGPVIVSRWIGIYIKPQCESALRSRERSIWWSRP